MMRIYGKLNETENMNVLFKKSDYLKNQRTRKISDLKRSQAKRAFK